MTVVETDRRRGEIESLGPWFHNLHLPDGAQTAPEHFLGDFPSFKWLEIAPFLPADLTGWSVLDIGCNAGYYTFQLAGRGAEVLGVDVDDHYLRQARWAAKELGLGERVRFRRRQVYDLARSSEKFDLVLFMGVLYHLRYPLLALDIVSEKVGRLMVFQMLTKPGQDVYDAPLDTPFHERDALCEAGWPSMSFIEHRLAGDPTNSWAPNHAAVEAMLRASGLKIIGRPGHEIYTCVPNPDRPSAVATWDRHELLAATGQAYPRTR